MLKDTYIPSHVHPEDLSPDTPVEQKLKAVESAEVTVAPVLIEELGVPIRDNHFQVYLCDTFRDRIPYVKGMRFELCEGKAEDQGTLMEVEWLDVGDDKLYGKGIGTRLLRKAVEFSMGTHEDFSGIYMSPANLGIVNTFSKVLGQEHISFRKNVPNKGMTWYGEGHELPLEAVLDDAPYQKGERYLVQELRASVHPEIIRSLGEKAVNNS